MVGRRPRNGDRRIDAAIDHFTPMGYSKAVVRSTINKLLKDAYGKDGWPFLEDNGYYVVQEALLEKQEQEDQLQLQLQQQQQGVEQQEEEAQQQEAMQEAPLENNMPIVEMHNEIPSEAVLVGEEAEVVVNMIIDPPAPEATLLLPAATGNGRTRRPCYGWISESESDSDNEEQPASQKHEVHVPIPGGELLCKRKRTSRWDVK